MRQIFISMLLWATLNSFGQILYYDFKRYDYPHLEISYPDSINSVDVYKYEAYFTSSPKTPASKGKLLYHIVLDDNHRKSEIINYNTTTGNIEAKYIFNYSQINLEEITMLNEYNKIRHHWLFKNGKLIEEVRYNFKQEVTDIWSYSYINDTLIETFTKHNKQDNVLCELKYKYDSLNRLIEEKEFKNDSLVYIDKMIYDTAGKLNRIKYYPPKVTVWSFLVRLISCQGTFLMRILWHIISSNFNMTAWIES
ncbi:MAG: hypothetical protein IPO21_02795 [Bacteroidales bacterium]|nr:hypothetical protein [Bacteroidales bacterium]